MFWCDFILSRMWPWPVYCYYYFSMLSCYPLCLRWDVRDCFKLTLFNHSLRDHGCRLCTRFRVLPPFSSKLSLCAPFRNSFFFFRRIPTCVLRVSWREINKINYNDTLILDLHFIEDMSIYIFFFSLKCVNRNIRVRDGQQFYAYSDGLKYKFNSHYIKYR